MDFLLHLLLVGLLGHVSGKNPESVFVPDNLGIRLSWRPIPKQSNTNTQNQTGV